jgi:GxxExxY protein
MLIDADFNATTHQILGAAIEYRILGPGLLESAHMPCLLYELHGRNLRYVTQRAIPLVYKGIRLEGSYRVDLIVEDTVVVEVKSVVTMNLVYHAQALTYMRLTDCPAGLVINFNVPRLMDGVKRLVLKAGLGASEIAGAPEKRSKNP